MAVAYFGCCLTGVILLSYMHVHRRLRSTRNLVFYVVVCCGLCVRCLSLSACCMPLMSSFVSRLKVSVQFAVHAFFRERVFAILPSAVKIGWQNQDEPTKLIKHQPKIKDSKQTVLELLELTVLDAAGETIGSFSVKPTATVGELKADLCFLTFS